MAKLTQDDVLQVLKRIAAPDGRGNVVSAGLVSDIAIQGGTVMFALDHQSAAPEDHGNPARCSGEGRARHSGRRQGHGGADG